MSDVSAQASALPGVAVGRRIGIGFKTSPQRVDWSTLDAMWSTAGELDVFDSAWINDHLTTPQLEHGGSSFESLTMMAALAHRVPGKWIGHAVLSNTFRHPAVTAKAATTLDNISGGRFIAGLGAGWHLGEHTAMGIALPPIGERIDRLRSAVRVLRALFSEDAASPQGVTLDDRFYPLAAATNEPAPVQAGGPPIWLGGQRERGLRLAATEADGWFDEPGRSDDPVETFRGKREIILQGLEQAGRDPAAFSFVASVQGDADSPAERRAALAEAKQLVQAGATHMIIRVRAAGGPDAIRLAARDVAEPFLAEVG